MATLTQLPKSVTVSSSAYANGEPIPSRYTCDGVDASPPLAFADLPAGAKAIALVMDDPDAPRGTWTHWTFWNLPTTTTKLMEGQDVTKLGARQGKTDFGTSGYGGPCPPSGTHRYFIRVYAQAAPIDLAAGASVRDLVKALESTAIAWGELLGTYSRS